MSNRLEAESSPYLRQHADNPVDWYPWGPEAFRRAQAEDKPIFLSVGYAACHWCHVMAHESFQDPDIAAILNRDFINIKVDREERPDVDTLYMEAVVSMTGQGGWPLSVFLTPRAEPFYGGTHFPSEPRYGLPAFRDVLSEVSRAWKEDRQRLVQTGAQITAQVASPLNLGPTEGMLDPSILERASASLIHNYDRTHGGWGGGPKFPQATTIEVLFRRYDRSGDVLARDVALQALHNMAEGGIFDHVGGGFHRYTVDRKWHIPHFEKMLYDNALMSHVYLDAWLITGEEIFRTVAESTLDFMLREMRHHDGGFYSSLDADSEGEEGRFYVWTPKEIREALEDEETAALLISAFGITEAGNFKGRNILHRELSDHSLAELSGSSPEEVRSSLNAALNQLLPIRGQRIRPLTDDKVITAWNGLTLLSFAHSAKSSRRAGDLLAAQELASFLLDRLVVGGQLKRSWREGRARHTAYLEDHAALGLGLLALYQTDFNPRWYSAAVRQAQEILKHFLAPGAGFYDTRDDHEKLIARPRSLQDTPTPSGNTLAVMLLLRLAALTGENQYSDPAETMIRAMQANAERHPNAFAGWLCALDFALGPQLQLAIIGSPTDEAFRALQAAVADRYLPRLVVAGGVQEAADLPTLLDERDLIDGRATAYLCQQFSCQLPTTSPEVLRTQLEEAP